ncbi:Uncharacterized conserved protein [Janthinobacterium sp. Marseille]|nr:Uncharacterized conserved protein [Janthinobacterium sp. Marseille]
MVWLSIALMACLLSKNIRPSVYGVVKALCQTTVLMSLILAALWIFLSASLLHFMSLWQLDNLKTTLLWSVTFAFMSMFKVINAGDSKAFFTDTIREALRLGVVVTFITELYTFPLWVEFFLLPLLFTIGGMYVVAQFNPEHAPAEKFCYTLLALIGSALVANGFYQAAQDMRSFFSLENMRDFIVPILLTFLYLPFAYCVSIYASYDASLRRLNNWIKDNALRRFAKRRAVLAFGVDVDFLNRWTQERGAFPPLESKKDVLDSLSEMKRRKQRERRPPVIEPSAGWSPYAAMTYLADQELSMNSYGPKSWGDWQASSGLHAINKEPLIPDNISYVIEGNESVVTKLSVTLFINSLDAPLRSEDVFANACRTILSKANRPDLSQIANRILDVGNDDEILSHGHRVSLRKEMFSGGFSRYQKTFKIEKM